MHHWWVAGYRENSENITIMSVPMDVATDLLSLAWSTWSSALVSPKIKKRYYSYTKDNKVIIRCKHFSRFLSDQ